MKGNYFISAIKKAILAAMLLIGCCCGVEAQTYKSLTPQQNESIKKSAQETLGQFKDLLSSCSQANFSNIEDYFTGATAIFLNKTVPIDDDRDDPSLSVPGNEKEIEIYLSTFNVYFPANKDNSVDFTVKYIYPVQRSKNRLLLRILYEEVFNGKDNNGRMYAKKDRVAEMVILPVGNEWKTYITAIRFINKSKPYDESNAIPIVSSAGSLQDTAGKPEEYYMRLLTKGDGMMSVNHFADAYAAYLEAMESGSTLDAAKNRMSELKSKMISANITDLNDAWYRGLKDKAHALEQKHKYDEAKKYYQYALETHASDNEIPEIITNIDARIQIRQKLEALYTKKAYDAAVMGYTDAIKDDPENAGLYIGIAKCYGQMPGKENEVLTSFRKAIELDQSNPDAYKWQGKYYEQKKNYESAYAAFILYSAYMEDKLNPEFLDIQLHTLFYKGVAAFNKSSYQEALDSFSALTEKQPDNAEAICYAGRCYTALNEKKEALNSFKKAIAINSKYPDAHYWRGYVLSVYHSKNLDDNSTEAIKEMKTAISYEPNNDEWNLGLGTALQRQGSYKEAMKCYAICINDESTPARQQALRKRAQCEYHLNNYAQAIADYNNIAQRSRTDNRDIGFVYLKLEKVDSAMKYFDSAYVDISNPEVMFGRAEAIYLLNPYSSEKPFLPLFKDAFAGGISHELVDNNPIIGKLENDGAFRKIKRNYGY